MIEFEEDERFESLEKWDDGQVRKCLISCGDYKLQVTWNPVDADAIGKGQVAVAELKKIFGDAIRVESFDYRPDGYILFNSAEAWINLRAHDLTESDVIIDLFLANKFTAVNILCKEMFDKCD